jgi:alkylation response protein AidB-like acyl-CoA dehydrogenase
VLQHFGTPEQQAHYLPRILSGEDWWCQGYSERAAGSDLAALRTTAVREGDRYIINGDKLWTTQAHFATMMFALVRTRADTRKQAGISFVMIPMNAPGITVRPITTIEHGHTVNEIFLDEVSIPAQNCVGPENEGWMVSRHLLGYERAFIGDVPRNKQRLRRLQQIARKERTDNGTLAEDPDFRRRMAQAEVSLLALERLNFKVLGQAVAGTAGSSIEANMLKIRGSEVNQMLNELMLDALGPSALPYAYPPHDPVLPEGVMSGHADGVMALHLYDRAAAIYGGSNEIQRNVIANALFR